MAQRQPTHLFIVYNDRGEPFIKAPLSDAGFDDNGLLKGIDCRTGMDYHSGVGSLHSFELQKISSPIDVPVMASH